MERIRFIIEQVEESKKLIMCDDISQFRMAYILLDNAAEIIMHRRIISDLSFNTMHRQIRESLIRGMTREQLKKFEKEVTSPHIIDRKREKLLKKYFSEKTKYLSEDKAYISKSIASILRSLHKYRNEIY